MRVFQHALSYLANVDAERDFGVELGWVIRPDEGRANGDDNDIPTPYKWIKLLGGIPEFLN